MNKFLSGFFGGVVGGFTGVLFYQMFYKGMPTLPTAAPTASQMFLIKRTINGGTVQVIEYLQSDYLSFGDIATALKMDQSNASTTLAFIQLQNPVAILTIEAEGVPTLTGHEY